MNFADIVQLAATLLTFAALAYSVLALRGARAYSRACRAPLPDFFPTVSVLKPVKGLDADTYAALASHCRQDYPAEYEILFGVGSMGDPAVAAVERLRREFPGRQIRLVTCPQELGTNGKVSSLAQMVPHARFEYLLINDSDIHVSPRYLRNVLPVFGVFSGTQKPAGMVTALYRGRPQGTLGSMSPTLGSRLESLGISTDLMPGVLAARWLERGIRFGLGATLAVTREALNAAGGFEALVNYLADDYELGDRIARAGYRVELAREVVETSVPAYKFSQFIEHQLRWARGVRDSRKLGYTGLVATFGVPWALCNVIASAGSLDSWALLSVMVCVRVALALTVGVGLVGDRSVLREFWYLPLRDTVALGIWFWSFAGNGIVWRGERFRLREGKLARE